MTIGGEISSNIFYDYLKVFLLPANETLEPTEAYDLSGEYSYAMADYSQNVILQHFGINAICQLDGTQTINITIPTPVNEQRKLVFLWRNNNMLANQPGAIIDNISITTLGGVVEETCLAPTNVEVSQITSNSAFVTWTPQGNETAWQVKLNQEEVIDVTTPYFTLTNLLPTTEYDVLVRANCGEGVSEWVITSFTTLDTVINPQIQTLPATQITQTSARLNAEIIEGTEEIMTKGFFYKEVGQAEWISVMVEDEIEISTIISNLLPQTTYVFKAFLTIENTLIEGEELTFTTDESSLAEIENAIEVSVYPNPVNRDNAIRFETTYEKVEVYNSLGVVVAEYANVDQISCIEAAGIYVIKVANDNVVKYSRVIVK